MADSDHYPGAKLSLLGPQTEPAMSAHDIICLHTMAGSMASTKATFEPDGFGGVESHFGIGPRGECIQWQVLSHTADANLDGNHHVISIETADKGTPFPEWSGSNVPGWTKAQLDTIVDLVGWLSIQFSIPPELIPDTIPGHRGIAYHRQGIEGDFATKDGLVPGGERWSDDRGKVCPGNRRIRQLKDTVIPRVQELVAGEKPLGRSGATAPAKVRLGRVTKAASSIVEPGVSVIEAALVSEGLLEKGRSDGMWGPLTTDAYARWQKRCRVRKSEIDGIPDLKTLKRLGKKHNFTVKE
jgi:hypothetical protein